MSRFNTITAAVLAALGLALWQVPVQSQTAAATQSSAERGVTIKVTPRTTAEQWTFAVALDTHSGSLDDDLAKAAVLVLDGREVNPSKWTGPGAGGHHREGLLSFPAPAQPPATVELRIQRSGEDAPRVFRWDGAALR
jgi:hypothetical protein